MGILETELIAKVSVVSSICSATSERTVSLPDIFVYLVSSPSSFPVTTTIAVIVSVFVLGLLFVAGMCTYRRRRKMFSHAEITSL